MNCPNCGVYFRVQEEEGLVIVPYPEKYQRQVGHEITGFCCPECNQLIIQLVQGGCANANHDYYMEAPHHEPIMIYPKLGSEGLNQAIPDKYQKDYKEASAILRLSPKASAAISRRLLQMILRDQFNIKKKDLYQEIEAFIALTDIPSYLADSVDAIRNIGNFAAHPLKSTQTGEIIEVEDGEAEWLLEVLEDLFDVAFVQPIKLQERKQRLNERFFN